MISQNKIAAMRGPRGNRHIVIALDAHRTRVNTLLEAARAVLVAPIDDNTEELRQLQEAVDTLHYLAAAKSSQPVQGKGRRRRTKAIGRSGAAPISEAGA